MGVEFVSPPSGKAIRLVVFSEKIGSQDSRQEKDEKKMYVLELRNRTLR
jgi:hypothetical protein